VQVAIDDEPLIEWQVTGDREDYEATVDHATTTPDGLIALQLTSETFDADGHGVGVLDAQAVSLPAWVQIGWSALRGAASGLLIALLLFVGRAADPAPRRAERATALPAGGPDDWPPAGAALRHTAWRAPALLGLSTLLFLSAWALAKPALQAPDEHGHIVKALSMPGHPWIARQDVLSVPVRLWNPIVAPVPQLEKLMFSSAERLTDADIAALKAVAWADPDGPPVERFNQAWTYPPLFYWVALAGGWTATWALDLAPYASLLAWRFWIVLLAAALWAWVHRVLGELPELREHRLVVVLFVVLNPMLAFISSAVNPDALFIPLAALAVVYSYILLREGRHAGTVCAVLILAGLTKPSALLLMAALASATLALGLVRRVTWPDVWTWARPVGAAFAVLWFTFYWWSATRLYGPPAGEMTAADYAQRLLAGSWSHWVSYWGRLGWLDYEAHGGFYAALAAIVAASAATAAPAARRWWREGSFPLFAGLVGLAFVAGTYAGAFFLHPGRGLNLQGRYLLPASIGLAMLVLPQRRAWRVGVVAFLVVFNLALFQGTIDRYFDGDWGRAWRAQPFAASAPPQAPPAVSGS
jgi:hypothetical protein